jgi:hypothetical protein
MSKLAFLDRPIGQHSLKTNQLSVPIATSPEGTAENAPGRKSWVNFEARECRQAIN